MQVWHCTEKEKTELGEAEHGHFFSHESYVVLYKRADKRDSYVMYYWMGSRARPVGSLALRHVALSL
jgi:hypothetical protein